MSGLADILYLDANASVPVDDEALARFMEVVRSPGNPSSPHRLGRQQRRALDRARDEVAASLKKPAHEIVFTSGASEGNRWLTDAVALLGAQQKRVPRVLTSPLEHPSLRKPLRVLAAQKKIELSEFSVDQSGNIEGEIQGADVIFHTLAHNETGLILKSQVLRAQAPEALIFADGAQAWARVDLEPDVDGVVFSAHKMGGISGAGCMWLSQRGLSLPSPWAGGGQEIGRRPGTEALGLVAAMGAAAQTIEDKKAAHLALCTARDVIEATLIESWGARPVGAKGQRLPNTTALCVPDVDPDVLRMKLDRAGVAVGFGAACSALAPEPSPGLMALGLSEKDALRCVRISLAPGFDDNDLDQAVQRLRHALE